MRFSVSLAALLGAGLAEAQFLISELSFGYAGRYVLLLRKHRSIALDNGN